MPSDPVRPADPVWLRMSGWQQTCLQFEDSECVRCRRSCGPMDDPVYVHKGEGLVCVECYEAEHSDGQVTP